MNTFPWENIKMEDKVKVLFVHTNSPSYDFKLLVCTDNCGVLKEKGDLRKRCRYFLGLRDTSTCHSTSAAK